MPARAVDVVEEAGSTACSCCCPVCRLVRRAQVETGGCRLGLCHFLGWTTVTIERFELPSHAMQRPVIPGKASPPARDGARTRKGQGRQGFYAMCAKPAFQPFHAQRRRSLDHPPNLNRPQQPDVETRTIGHVRGGRGRKKQVIAPSSCVPLTAPRPTDAAAVVPERALSCVGAARVGESHNVTEAESVMGGARYRQRAPGAPLLACPKVVKPRTAPDSGSIVCEDTWSGVRCTSTSSRLPTGGWPGHDMATRRRRRGFDGGSREGGSGRAGGASCVVVSSRLVSSRRLASSIQGPTHLPRAAAAD